MPDVTDRPRAKSLRPLRALWPFLAPHWVLLSGALGALLVAAAAMLALPAALRQLIDHGLASANPRVLNAYLAGFLVAAAAFGVFAALRFYLVTWLGERVVADLRQAVYRRVVRMDPTFFEVTRTGEVLSRLTADTTLVQAIAGVNLSITLRSALNLCGAVVLLALTSTRLTIWILALMPIVIVPMIVIGRRVRRLSRATQDRIADTSSLVDESLNAIQTVQAFTLEELQSRRYGAAVEHSFAAAIRRTRVRAALTGIGTMLVFGGITYVLWLGAHAVLVHAMTWGQLSQFFIYAAIVGTAAASLTEMWGEMQRAAGAMERLSELLQAQPAISAPAQPLLLPARVRGDIAFEHVSFRYPSRPDTLALDDYTLAVRRGETVAVVGPSGAGKSTSFQLLLRFYDPQSGRITIDGHDIRRLRPGGIAAADRLRAAGHGVVWRQRAREYRLWTPGSRRCRDRGGGARAPRPMSSCARLPAGYDTFLGERGTRLSGGQRQRIAIARAILQGCADPAAGRGHQFARRRVRAAGAAALARADARPHHAGDRASAGHGAQGRPHRGTGGRAGGGGGNHAQLMRFECAVCARRGPAVRNRRSITA